MQVERAAHGESEVSKATTKVKAHAVRRVCCLHCAVCEHAYGRHIEVRHHFVVEATKAGVIELDRAPTADQLQLAIEHERRMKVGAIISQKV